MYGCESWTIKKAEHWRIDAFQLWCWRRLLRVPWTARRSNQVNPKGHQPWIFFGRTDDEAEAPILWPPEEVTHWKRPWYWERLKTEGEEGNRGWDGWIPSPIQWTWAWENSRRWWGTGEAWCAAIHGVAKSQIWLGWLNNNNQGLMMLNIFSCACTICSFPLEKCLYRSFAHFLIELSF